MEIGPFRKSRRISGADKIFALRCWNPRLKKETKKGHRDLASDVHFAAGTDETQPLAVRLPRLWAPLEYVRHRRGLP
jgi:hypothetical protein